MQQRVWTPAPHQAAIGYRVDPKRCAQSVQDIYGVSFHQCPFKGKHEQGGRLWCGKHVVKREAEREVKS